jgi:hypothetical protein
LGELRVALRWRICGCTLLSSRGGFGVLINPVDIWDSGWYGGRRKGERPVTSPQTTPSARELLDRWGVPDPENIGQSEYRAVHDAVADGMAALSDLKDPSVAQQDALALLDQIIRSARSMRLTIIGAEPSAFVFTADGLEKVIP